MSGITAGEIEPEVKVPGDKRARQARVKTALVILTALSLGPYAFMALTSLKTNQQFADNFWAPSFPIHLENYAAAAQQIAPYLGNSFLVAGVSVIFIAVISSVSGFILSRFRFRGRAIVYVSLLILMAVPNIATLIPLFIMMRDFGILNSYAVLIIPYVSGGIVIGTILMRNFIASIPQTIYDAARVDGANGWRLYWNITVPLSLPVIGSIALLTVTSVWNDFFWPLLVISEDGLRTASVGLQYFQGQNALNYGPLMAGYVIASLPLVALFVFLSKHFLAGVQGGVAGAH